MLMTRTFSEMPGMPGRNRQVSRTIRSTRTPACEARYSAAVTSLSSRAFILNWISAGLKFDAIVSNNDEMAIGAIQSLKTAKMLDKVIVAGVDATTDALAAMQAGELEVTVFQNAAAQGQGAVDTALKIAKGEKVPSMVWIPFELVTPANIKNYLQKN